MSEEIQWAIKMDYHMEALVSPPNIEYASEHGYELQKAEGSAGYDIRTPVDIYLPPGSEMCVHTGLRIRINSQPGEPFFTLLVPRSSAGVKKDLVIKNTVGVIDPGYCGDDDEILVFLRRRPRAQGELVGYIPDNWTLEDHFVGLDGDVREFERLSHTVQGNKYIFEGARRSSGNLLYNAGERFAQILFLPYGSVDPIIVDSLADINRGGFGSTGNK